MKYPLTLILLALAAAALFACESEGGSNGPASTGQPPDPGSGPTTVQLVITNDAAQIDLEDEELQPILERIMPQFQSRLTASGLSGADVQFIAPRSIVIQIEGDAATIIPQVQQIIAEGNFEIPLSVTQLASQ
jgi:hypothetical protein